MSLEKSIRNKIEGDLNHILKQLKELEEENTNLKKEQQSSSVKGQFQKNFKILEIKYQKQFKKYMKCLFKYGIYQSSLNNVILEYNKIIDVLDMIKDEADFQSKLIELNINIHDFSKISIQSCLLKYGMVYENNHAIGENQMEKIIHSRLKKETQENKAIFYSGIQNSPNKQTSQLIPEVQTNLDKTRSLSQQSSQQSSKSSSFWRSKSIIELLKTKINSKSQEKSKPITIPIPIVYQGSLESDISLKISTMKDQTTFSSQPSQGSVEIVLSSIAEPTNSIGLQRDNDMSSQQIQMTEQSQQSELINNYPTLNNQFVRLNQTKKQFEYIDGTEINQQMTERFSNESSRNHNYSNYDTNKINIEVPVKQENKQLETQRYIRKIMSEREYNKDTNNKEKQQNQFKMVQQRSDQKNKLIVQQRSDQKNKNCQSPPRQDENYLPQRYHQFLNDQALQNIELRNSVKSLSLYQPQKVLQDRANIYINQNDQPSNKQELFISKPKLECTESRIKPSGQTNLEFFSFDQENMKFKTVVTQRMNGSDLMELSQKKFNQINTSISSIRPRGFSPDRLQECQKYNETLNTSIVIKQKPQSTLRSSFSGKRTNLSELLKSEDMDMNQIINHNLRETSQNLRETSQNTRENVQFSQRHMEIQELDDEGKKSRRRSRAERLNH